MDEKTIQECKFYLIRKKSDIIDMYKNIKAKNDFELKIKLELIDSLIIDLMFKEKKI